MLCGVFYETQEVSKVFDKFKQFEAVTTNDARESIGTLGTDNGGEYRKESDMN